MGKSASFVSRRPQEPVHCHRLPPPYPGSYHGPWVSGGGILKTVIIARYGGAHLSPQDSGKQGQEDSKFEPSVSNLARPSDLQYPQYCKNKKQLLVYFCF